MHTSTCTRQILDVDLLRRNICTGTPSFCSFCILFYGSKDLAIEFEAALASSSPARVTTPRYSTFVKEDITVVDVFRAHKPVLA